MKKSTIAISLVAALGVAAVGGAWFTGSQIEQRYAQLIENSNKELKLLAQLLKTTKTKKQKEYGIWREKTGLNGRELLKTGALRCIAPVFILREKKTKKKSDLWLVKSK